MKADLDHVSFAVADATAWGQKLRCELGATPIAGETLPEFRWLLMHVGTASGGSRIELMEPVATGFLTRFLDRHGEGPHHLTFTVPHLPTAVETVRSLGAVVVREDYGHPPWEEAFIFPDERHGVVLQLASTDRDYPDPSTLLATKHREVDTYPSSRGATDSTWWLPVWEAPPGPQATLERTHLAVTDLGFSERLFGGVLGGARVPGGRGLEFDWPRGRLALSVEKRAGVRRLDLSGSSREVTIGDVRIGAPIKN